MSGFVSLELRGFDGLRDQLKEFGQELAIRTLAKAARKAFKPVLEEAVSRAPRDTGELADSMKLRVIKSETRVAVGITFGRASQAAGRPGEVPPARRWHWLELGTVKMQAHPFLRPALDANAQAVVDGLAEELRKAIRKVAKR